MVKLGATRPLRKLSQSGRRPAWSHTFTTCTSIITITAQPRSWSIQSQRLDGVRSVQVDMGHTSCGFLGNLWEHIGRVGWYQEQGTPWAGSGQGGSPKSMAWARSEEHT